MVGCQDGLNGLVVEQVWQQELCRASGIVRPLVIVGATQNWKKEGEKPI
jgi:hypothetical protein